MKLFGLSKKETEVALRLSSTSGCEAAGNMNARGWPQGNGNSDSAKGTGIRGKDGKPGAGAKAVFLWCDSSKKPKSLRDKSLIS